MRQKVFINSAGSIGGRANHSLGFAELSQEVEKLLQSKKDRL